MDSITDKHGLVENIENHVCDIIDCINYVQHDGDVLSIVEHSFKIKKKLSGVEYSPNDKELQVYVGDDVYYFWYDKTADSTIHMDTPVFGEGFTNMIDYDLEFLERVLGYLVVFRDYFETRYPSYF